MAPEFAAPAIEDVPELTARLRTTIARVRPLAELLAAADHEPIDDRTAAEFVLLIQCLNDLMVRYGLDMETTTQRFKRWAMGSRRPWWALYQAAMKRERSAVRQMEREDL